MKTKGIFGIALALLLLCMLALPFKMFNVKVEGSSSDDEYFFLVEVTSFDNDGDGYDDAVEVRMDVDTTGGTLTVHVNGYLDNPGGSQVDEDSASWQIIDYEVEYGYIYLYVPAGNPEGLYRIRLYLYDDALNLEDTHTDSAYLHPPAPIGEPPIEIWENYTLNRDVTFIGDGFIIMADHVLLDLNGHTITGSGTGTGVSFAWNVYWQTIKNGTIKNFHNGINLGSYLGGGNNVTSVAVVFNKGWGIDSAGGRLAGGNHITKNIISSNGAGGITGSAHDFVMNNTITSNNGAGIVTAWGDGRIINNTIALNKGAGIDVYSEGGFTEVTGNRIYSNLGYGIVGWGPVVFSNNIISKNGQGGTYFGGWGPLDISNNIITENAGDGIYLLTASPADIEGNEITFNGGHGVNFIGDVYSTGQIHGNNFTENANDGIYLLNPKACDIIENSVSGSSCGIRVEGKMNAPDGGDNHFYNNTAIGNECGLFIDVREAGFTNPSIFRNNTLAANTYNFGIYGSDTTHFNNDIDSSNTVDGKPIYYLMGQKNLVINPSSFPDLGYLGIVNSYNINVSGLNLESNIQGILLANTKNCYIENVSIRYNHFGIYLWRSSNNRIYHNTFTNYEDSVYLEDSFNIWDDGYPSGGNFWSDYINVDLYRGSYQNVTGSDGIWDHSYFADANNQDNYPLTKPYAGTNDIGITTAYPSKTIIGKGYSLSINAIIINYGVHDETFDVTTYANTTLVDTPITITLTSRNSTTITFTWNTTGFAYGNYTIKTVVTTVLGEIDIVDNTYRDGTVLVTVTGDVNGDVRVNAFDLFDLSTAYGSTRLTPNWNPNCDINGDNKVDVSDVFVQGRNYGKTTQESETKAFQNLTRTRIQLQFTVFFLLAVVLRERNLPSKLKRELDIKTA